MTREWFKYLTEIYLSVKHLVSLLGTYVLKKYIRDTPVRNPPHPLRKFHPKIWPHIYHSAAKSLPFHTILVNLVHRTRISMSRTSSCLSFAIPTILKRFQWLCVILNFAFWFFPKKLPLKADRRLDLSLNIILLTKCQPLCVQIPKLQSSRSKDFFTI